jgi:hypothetical protein
MKLRYYFLALAGLLATSAHAQTHPDPAGVPPCASYTGNVVGNSKPLTGVSVAVEGTNIIIITNEEGFFALPPRVKEAPTLAISGAGFEPQKITFTSCAPLRVELVMLPGTRIKKHGKRKGFIMKDGIVREKRFR